MPKINVKRMKVRKKNNEWEAVPGFGEGVYPVDKTETMTQPVGRDAQGRLFTEPTGGGTVDVDPTLTQEGMAADAKATGDAIADRLSSPSTGSVGDVLTVSAVDADGKPTAVGAQKGVLTAAQELTEDEKAQARENVGAAATEDVPVVFDWAIAELPFTAEQISDTYNAPASCFVTNPTNFKDGKLYFRYHAGSKNFTWTNPNPQKGKVTLTVLSWNQWDKTSTGNSSALYFCYSDGSTTRNTPKNGVTATFESDPDKTLTQIKGNYDIENWILLDLTVLKIVADYPAPAGKTVRYDEAQELTAEEQETARDNIGAVGAPQTAEVGELLAVEEVDEQGKPVKWKTVEQTQADWREYDTSAPDYVNNKPFFEYSGHEVLTIPAHTPSDTRVAISEKLQKASSYTLKDLTTNEKIDTFTLENDYRNNNIPCGISLYEGYSWEKEVKFKLYNNSDHPLQLSVDSYMQRIHYRYLSVPYTTAGVNYPGIVTTLANKTVCTDFARQCFSTSDGKIYTEVQNLYRDRFEVFLSDFESAYSYGAEYFERCLICQNIGTLSEFFPDITSTDYPLYVNFIKANGYSRTLLVRTVGGEYYKGNALEFESESGKNECISVGKVERVTKSYAPKYDTAIIKDDFSTENGYQTYDSIGLIEGQKYDIALWSGVTILCNCTATYVESVGMVVCASDGDYENLNNNRAWVGDTQAYKNSSWSSAYRGAWIDYISGYKQVPSIPLAAIEGIDALGTMIVIPTDNDDGTYTSNYSSDEITEHFNNGGNVVLQSERFPVPLAYIEDGRVMFAQEIGVAEVAIIAIVSGNDLQIEMQRYSEAILNNDAFLEGLADTWAKDGFAYAPAGISEGQVLAYAGMDKSTEISQWVAKDVYTKAEIDTALGSYITDVDALIGGDDNANS